MSPAHPVPAERRRPPGNDAILVINAGSSSIKFALFAPRAETPVMSGQVDGLGERPHIAAQDAAGRTLDDADIRVSGSLEEQHREALKFLTAWLDGHDMGFKVRAAGHRVVHGGGLFREPVVLTPEIAATLGRFAKLAPLHQPHNLNGIRALAAARPDLPQVACFDTAFHCTQPPVAQLFGLPRELSEEGVRRYGFHGLSYEYIARSLPAHLGATADERVVVAHLGNGASMCAMKGRRSVASTMGFTAIDGLLMGTRSGNLDPGVLLYLMENRGMNVAALTRLLYKESGLLGVSGISQDMRTLLASARPEAKEAVDLFCYRIVRELGSLAAACGGLDALVFTGGIGEHAAPVRAAVVEGAGWLGARLDGAANAAHARRISAPDSAVVVLVIPTNEEYMIASHTARLLNLA